MMFKPVTRRSQLDPNRACCVLLSKEIFDGILAQLTDTLISFTYIPVKRRAHFQAQKAKSLQNPYSYLRLNKEAHTCAFI